MKSDLFTLNLESSARFLIEGEIYFNSYIELIDKARKTIHLQTYIFEMDSFGRRVHTALIAAAQRGVKIYVLIDSVGSKELNFADEALLISNGIYFARFNSFNYRWLYQWSRRLHHKVLLVDHQQALVGGINVTTSGYGNKRREPQLDFAVALSGKTVRELVNYCQMIFIKSYPKPVVMEPIELRPYDVKIQTKNDLSLKISINDWVYGRQQITKAYTQRTRSAQREIIIINSYFFPRKKFMKELVRAAQRGVRVRLILAGISDWPSSILASQYLYDYFLKHGVEIYQWQKSVLHGKLATVDGNYTTIGSFSLNYTGYQQNLEMNVDIISGEFTSQVNSIIDEIIAVGCEKIEQNSFEQKTTLRLRFLRFVFYLILSIVASFSVTLTHQEKGHDSTP